MAAASGLIYQREEVLVVVHRKPGESRATLNRFGAKTIVWIWVFGEQKADDFSDFRAMRIPG